MKTHTHMHTWYSFARAAVSLRLAQSQASLHSYREHMQSLITHVPPISNPEIRTPHWQDTFYTQKSGHLTDWTQKSEIRTPHSLDTFWTMFYTQKSGHLTNQDHPKALQISSRYVHEVSMWPTIYIWPKYFQHFMDRWTCCGPSRDLHNIPISYISFLNFRHS